MCLQLSNPKTILHAQPSLCFTSWLLSSQKDSLRSQLAACERFGPRQAPCCQCLWHLLEALDWGQVVVAEPRGLVT